MVFDYRARRPSWGWVLAVSFLLASGRGFPADPPAIITVNFQGRAMKAVAGEIILEFRSDLSDEAKRRVVSSLGLRERLLLMRAPMGAYTILNGKSVEEVVSAAARTEGICKAGPSAVAELLSCSSTCGGSAAACPLPDDALYPGQLGNLGLTGMDQAWNDPSVYGAQSNPDITIWVNDSGVDPRHPDLVDKFLYDGAGTPTGFAVPGYPTFADGNGHGSFVAGIAAAATNNRDRYTLPLVQEGDTTGASPVLKNTMLTARRELSGGIVGSTIYAIGGRTARGQVLNTVEAYDVQTSIWTASLDPMPTARCQLAAAIAGDRIYAVGGSPDGSLPLAVVEVYDPAFNTWTTVTSMAAPRRGLAAAALGGTIYALGGHSATACVAVVEAYDPATGTWAAAPSLNVAREGLATAVLGGKLYAIGGDDGAGPVDTVEVWDGTATCWTVSDHPLHTRSSWLAAATDGSSLFVVGGEDAVGMPVGREERFDPATGWMQLDLADPVSRMAGAGWMSGDGVGHWAIIGGKGDGGMAGFARRASIVPVKVSDVPEGFPIIDGIMGIEIELTTAVSVQPNRLDRRSHQILNMSWGLWPSDPTTMDRMLGDLLAVERNGDILVGGAGNRGACRNVGGTHDVQA